MARVLSNSRLNKKTVDEGLAAVADAAKVRNDAVRNSDNATGSAREGVDSSGNAIANASGLTREEIEQAQAAVTSLRANIASRA